MNDQTKLPRLGEIEFKVPQVRSVVFYLRSEQAMNQAKNRAYKPR
jgi:hypothetical protein